MARQSIAPLPRLKVCVTGRCLRIAVVQDITDQMQRFPCLRKPRTYGSRKS